MKYYLPLLIIALFALTACSEKTIGGLEDFCHKGEAYRSVSTCGEYIKAEYDNLGGGITWLKDGQEIRCPVVGPDSMSAECKALAENPPACSETVECPATGGRIYQSEDPDVCSRIKFMCVEGMVYFGDETGCGCEPALTNPCAATLCMVGSTCEVQDGQPVCVPQEVRPCNLACVKGTHCVAGPDAPTCVPDAIPCTERTEACTKEYNPVCGRQVLNTGAERYETYGNGCTACAELKVVDYTDGACAPPADYVECTDPRPEICTMEYNPVCATVDTGIRCIMAPCDGASEQKTYATGCTACADPKVYGYVPGECAPAMPKLLVKRYIICDEPGIGRENAEQNGWECVDACPDGYDAFTAQIGRVCIAHVGAEEIAQWVTCETRNDCTSEQACALVDVTTDGKPVDPAFRCAPNTYADFKVNSGLTVRDENGQESMMIS